MLKDGSDDNEFLSEVNRLFATGLENFEERNYQAALDFFSQANNSAEAFDPQRHRYLSYMGVCEVMMGEITGLDRCRKAALEETRFGDVFCNLAIAEFNHFSRRRALSAIQRGIRIDPRSSTLQSLLNQIDTRRRPLLPFLSRNNPINRIAGKVSYKLIPSRSKQKFDQHRFLRPMA